MTHWFFVRIFWRGLHPKTVRETGPQFLTKVHLPSCVMCPMSCVTCQVSRVVCNMSCVRIFFLLLSDKVMKLIGGGSIINRARFFFLHNTSSYSCKLVHIADRSASRFENLFKRSKENVLGIQTCLPCLCGSICFTIIMLTNHKGWMGGLAKPSNVNNWE